MAVLNKAQLITYADSLGGALTDLDEVLRTRFSGLFPAGVHILPPFPSSADRGFAPKTYFEIEPALGSWTEMKSIGSQVPVVVDVMVNHISRQSEYFQDFVAHGRQSKWADLFIPVDKVWPNGVVPEEDRRKIYLRKPEHPFSDIVITDTGKMERVWTTFGTKDWSEQVDLDVNSDLTRKFLKEIFRHLSQNGIQIVRLDAVGYVTKKAGTPCFFNEPEIWDFMAWIKNLADGYGIELLPEVHSHVSYQNKLVEKGYWVYDFVLPGLVLHTLTSGQTEELANYMKSCPRRQFTTLDCHDGIPVLPDLEGVLDVPSCRSMVKVCELRGANVSRVISEHKAEGGFDAHQINITYYEALGCNDNAYIAARAIQMFTPGVPQVYYVGLLAGKNDPQARDRAKDGRAINRHDYTMAEIDEARGRPVVQRLEALLRFRNTCSAFDGTLTVLPSAKGTLALSWTGGEETAVLKVDAQTYQTEIRWDHAGTSETWRP